MMMRRSATRVHGQPARLRAVLGAIAILPVVAASLTLAACASTDARPSPAQTATSTRADLAVSGGGGMTRAEVSARCSVAATADGNSTVQAAYGLSHTQFESYLASYFATAGYPYPTGSAVTTITSNVALCLLDGVFPDPGPIAVGQTAKPADTLEVVVVDQANTVTTFADANQADAETFTPR